MSSRALLRRWNRRVLRREWRQYVVIFALLASGVALSVGGVVAAHNLVEPPEAEFGNGTFAVWADDAEPLEAALVTAGLPHGRIDEATVAVAGTTQRIRARAIDPTNPIVDPLLSLLDGRWPDTDTELAVSDDAILDVTVGDTVVLSDGVRRSVVGLVENPTDLDDEFVLTASRAALGSVAPEVDTRFLVDADPSVAGALDVAGLTTASSGGPSARTVATLVGTVVSGLGMLEVGLLAGAGFAVVARRRMHQYGVLAAGGASPRHLRTAATGMGVVVGVLASACGGAIGVGVSAAVVSKMETTVGHRIAVEVPPVAVASVVAVAMVVAAVAARWPALAASRRPVADLLGAERPRIEATVRPAIAGAVITTLGATALGVGFARAESLFALVGVIATPVGLILLAPLMVRGVAAAGGRLRLAPRLAARSLGRHNRRSAAVVAAVALALAPSVAFAVVTASVDARAADDGPNLAEDWFVVWQLGAADDATRIPAALDPETLEQGLTRVTSADIDTTLIPIDVAVDPDARPESWDFDGIGSRPSVEPVLAARTGSDRCLSCDVYAFAAADGTESSWIVTDAWVATPAITAALHIDDPVVGAVAVAADDRYRPLAVIDPDRLAGEVAVSGSWPRNTTVPPMLVAPDAVAAAGLDTVTVGVLAVADAPLTVGERDLVRQALGPDLAVEFPAPPANRGNLRVVATAIGVMAALGIAAAAVALLAVELRADVVVLEAAGASPATVRRLGASVAALVAMAGSVLAMAMGLVAVVPLLTAAEVDVPVAVPWGTLSVMAVAFPAAAAAVGWLGARRSGPVEVTVT